MGGQFHRSLLMLAGVAACVDKGDKPIDPAYVSANILSEAPALQNAVDADLGGKVVYLGNDVDSRNLVPGSEVRVVHYWKVVAPPGAEWGVFSHLVGNGGEWMNVDYSDMRKGHPPAKWQAGQIIRDEHRFTLNKEWRSSFAQLAVGLYRKGQNGAGGRMPVVRGNKDAEGRVVAFRFAVDVNSSTAGRTPEYRVRRAVGPIAIDGIADEESWKNAPRSPEFVDAERGPKLAQATHARLLWDDANLYAFIEVKDNDVFSEFSERDATLWKSDVVELFIDADRNRRGYVELQVNPNNAVFDAFFPRGRGAEHHFEWNSGMKTGVVVHGTAGDRDDTDVGWDVEIAIPLVDVKGLDAAMRVQVPPHIGDRWRLNVVRVERPKGDTSIRASSWNAITIQDFHALDRMLEVVFAGPDR